MKYFSIEELCKSSTAKKNNINNIPTDDIKRNLTVLIEQVLDPIREEFKKPINVSSGFRCKQLNKIVGGVSNSYHTKGMAADLYGKTNQQTKLIFDIAKKLNRYTELLYERKGSSIWVHIAYNPKSSKHYVNDNYVVC